MSTGTKISLAHAEEVAGRFDRAAVCGIIPSTAQTCVMITRQSKSPVDAIPSRALWAVHRRGDSLGDAMETWKSVPGFELYEVSDGGRVRWALSSQKTNKRTPGDFPKTWMDDQGYTRVTLNNGAHRDRQKIKFVHVLVALAFFGSKPKGKECNHKDGRHKEDCSVHNLEYVTHRENILHAHATGLAVIIRGVNHGMAKLCDEKVRAIRDLSAAGNSSAKIAFQFGVSKKTILNIRHGKIWRHVA